jgi:hypothetical protein
VCSDVLMREEGVVVGEGSSDVLQDWEVLGLRHDAKTETKNELTW